MAAFAIIVTATSSCRDHPRHAARTVADSAGVQLITIPEPDSTIPKWRVLTETPLLVIGGSADSSGQFNFIGSAAVFPDGRLAVATEDEFRVHVFDSLGHPVGRFGRKGEGPGEIRRAPALYVYGDSLITVQERGRLIQVGVWNGRRELLREYQATLQVTHDDMYGPIGITDSASIMMMTAVTPLPPGAGGGPHRAKVTISRFTPPASEAVPVLGLPGDERYGLNGENGARDTYVQFGKTTVATVSGGLIQSGTNDGFEIDSWTPAGRLVRRLRIATTPQRVTREMRERHAREDLEDAPPDNRRLTELILSTLRYADYLRPYDALYPTQEGGLWIALSRVSDRDPRHFVIVDAEGRLVASTTLSAGLRPLWIRGDRILLRGRDANDVPFLGLYHIAR